MDVPYRTESGITIHLVPVREVTLMLAADKATKKFRDMGEPIDPPMFALESIGGDVVMVPHRPPTPEIVDEHGVVVRKADAGTLDVDDPRQTAYNWAVWERHQDALARLRIARLTETVQAYYYFGIKCEVPPDSEWLDEQEAFGLPIEEIKRDPVKRKVHYIVSVLLTPREQVIVQQLLRTMMLGQAVTKEKIAEVEDLFRRAAGGSGGGEIDDTIAALRALVGAPADGGVAGGESVGTES